MCDEKSRAWRELDLDALSHNARAIQAALAPDCRLMAVVKADAYGHGAVPVARHLESSGIKGFAVACLEEGIQLRRAGIQGQILILGYTPPEYASLLLRWSLTQTVADLSHGEALSAQGIPLDVQIALDTGMHRLGVPAGDQAALARLYQLPGLRIRGIYSHLCVSDSAEGKDQAFTQEQLKQYYKAVQWLKEQGYAPGQTHIQASYGVWNLPPQPCTWARAGIALYGVTSDGQPTRRDLGLRPALSLRARVASVRTLTAGEGAGYGLAFQARRTTTLAAVTIGYADGLPRDLPQRGGVVLLRGRRWPMVGRMCMDQLLVDMTGCPDVQPGEVVTLIGQDGPEELSAQNLAALCGTISNELLSRLGHRLPVLASSSLPCCSDLLLKTG